MEEKQLYQNCFCFPSLSVEVCSGRKEFTPWGDQILPFRDSFHLWRGLVYGKAIRNKKKYCLTPKNGRKIYQAYTLSIVGKDQQNSNSFGIIICQCYNVGGFLRVL